MYNTGFKSKKLRNRKREGILTSVNNIKVIQAFLQTLVEMGKTWKVIICGQAGVGKTAILEQLVNADHVIGSSMFSTIEDIYTVLIDTDKNQKEKLHIYDTAGLDISRAELPKHYLSFADGYLLVYDTTSESSFNCVDHLKKFIEKNKEKKEAVLVAIGNKSDLKELRQVDNASANKWSQTEKIRLFEASVGNRQTIIDPLVWLVNKMSQPPGKRFPPFGEGKKKNEQTL